MKTILAIIVVILLVLLAWRERTRPSPHAADPEVIITYVYDSIPYEVFVEKTYPVFVEVPLMIPQVVDTAGILSDYFKKRHYSDTLVNDKDLYFLLSETIYQNQVQERSFNYINRRPVKAEIQIECPAPQNHKKLFLGAHAGVNAGEFAAGPSAGWLARGTLFYYQYDVINGRHQVGVMVTSRKLIK